MRWAALVGVQPMNPGLPRIAPVLPVQMMAPDPRASIPGPSVCAVAKQSASVHPEVSLEVLQVDLVIGPAAGQRRVVDDHIWRAVRRLRSRGALRRRLSVAPMSDGMAGCAGNIPLPRFKPPGMARDHRDMIALRRELADGCEARAGPDANDEAMLHALINRTL